MFRLIKSHHYCDTVGYVLCQHRNCKMWYQQFSKIPVCETFALHLPDMISNNIGQTDKSHNDLQKYMPDR